MPSKLGKSDKNFVSKVLPSENYLSSKSNLDPSTASSACCEAQHSKETEFFFEFKRISFKQTSEVHSPTVYPFLLACFFVVMDSNLEDHDAEDSNDTIKAVTKRGQGKMSKTCNQCKYRSSHAGTLSRHLKTHTGEKTHKCKLCDYASSQASNLRIHLKTHSGEKPNKCNQCDYASSGRRFEETFENTQWRKVKQMQPM